MNFEDKIKIQYKIYNVGYIQIGTRFFEMNDDGSPDFEVQVDEIIAAETTAVSTTTSTETTTAATTAALTETKNVSSTAKSTTKAASAKNSSPKTSDTMPVVGLFGLTAALTALMARKKND